MTKFQYQFNHVPCGSVGFYLAEMPKVGEIILPEGMELLDGTTPEPGSPILCGHCGEPVQQENLHPRHVTERRHYAA